MVLIKYRLFPSLIKSLLLALFWLPLSFAQASDLSDEDKKAMAHVFSKLLGSTNPSLLLEPFKEEIYQIIKKSHKEIQVKDNVSSNADYVIWQLEDSSSSKGSTDSTLSNTNQPNIDHSIDTIPGQRDSNLWSPVTKENYLRFYGKVETFFEGHSPLLGTGVALDAEFVLTLASCVSLLDKKPTAINFISYHPEEKKHNKTIKVSSVIFSTYFSELEENTEQHNFALLKLNTPLPLEKKVFPLLKEDNHFVLHGFKGHYNQLHSFPISSLTLNPKQDFLKYEVEVPAGVGGAPILLNINGHYYIVGLHAGGDNPSNKKVLWLKSNLQEKIEAMKKQLNPLSQQEKTPPQEEALLDSLSKFSLSKESKELNLSGRSLKPTLFLEIAKTLKETPSITFLNLSHCNMDDIQAVRLAGSLMNLVSSLQKIDLRDNKIESKGAQSLLAFLENNQKKLNQNIQVKLKGNQIEESILEKIKALYKEPLLKQDLESLTLSSILFAIKQQQPKYSILSFIKIKDEDLEQTYLKKAYEHKLLEDNDLQFIKKEWGIDLVKSSGFFTSHEIKFNL